MKNSKILLPVYLLLFSACLLLAGCKQDNKKLIVNKWKMENEDVVFNVKKDGTYIFTESEISDKGSWSLSADGKTLSLTEEGEGSKNLEVVELSRSRLVLSDNGDELVFVEGE